MPKARKQNTQKLLQFKENNEMNEEKINRLQQWLKWDMRWEDIYYTLTHEQLEHLYDWLESKILVDGEK